jgi:hypothetical protein
MDPPKKVDYLAELRRNRLEDEKTGTKKKRQNTSVD